MDTTLLKKVENKYLRKDLPEFEIGDTIAVHTIIREGEKNRTQVFKGIVLSIKGSGLDKSFTVRKISSGIGVEKTFPMNSTNIEKIEFIRKAKTRRSKLYYMRERIGKRATKISAGLMSKSMKEQHESLEQPKDKSPDSTKNQKAESEDIVVEKQETEEKEKKQEKEGDK